MMTGRNLNEYGDILTVKELAQYLGCCTNTVYAMLKRRKIRAKRIGRDWAIPRKSIEKFFSE